MAHRFTAESKVKALTVWYTSGSLLVNSGIGNDKSQLVSAEKNRGFQATFTSVIGRHQWMA
jgi:hypothetical protein